jgi:hypothetical protein
MDHKLILFTALFLLSMLLYVGLPEHKNSVASEPASLSGERASDSSAAKLADEVRYLRKEQARLNREMRLLKVKLDSRASLSKASDGSGPFCTERDPSDDASGLTVFLETTDESTPQDSGPMWTAVSVRDAGHSSDGSARAVVGIHKGLSLYPRQVPARAHRQVNW